MPTTRAALATEFLLLLILAAIALIAGDLLVRTPIWHAIALSAVELLVAIRSAHLAR